MTENAARFVSKLTFETLSGHRVVTDMWARDFEWEVEHISFAQRADIFVVAPCTLNMAGKLAARHCRTIFCPRRCLPRAVPFCSRRP